MARIEKQATDQHLKKLEVEADEIAVEGEAKLFSKAEDLVQQTVNFFFPLLQLTETSATKEVECLCSCDRKTARAVLYFNRFGELHEGNKDESKKRQKWFIQGCKMAHIMLAKHFTLAPPVAFLHPNILVKEGIHSQQHIQLLSSMSTTNVELFESSCGQGTWCSIGHNLAIFKSIVNEIMIPGTNFSRYVVISRPPRHHARFDSSSGFCFTNELAWAAISLAKDGKRVAVVDLDVHHGDGTQDIITKSTPGSLLAISVHRYTYPVQNKKPVFFPGSGDHDNTKIDERIINVGLTADGCTDDDYYFIVNSAISPILKTWSVEIVFLAVRFDVLEGPAGIQPHKVSPIGLGNSIRKIIKALRRLRLW